MFLGLLRRALLVRGWGRCRAEGSCHVKLDSGNASLRVLTSRLVVVSKSTAYLGRGSVLLAGGLDEILGGVVRGFESQVGACGFIAA